NGRRRGGRRRVVLSGGGRQSGVVAPHPPCLAGTLANHTARTVREAPPEAGACRTGRLPATGGRNLQIRGRRRGHRDHRQALRRRRTPETGPAAAGDFCEIRMTEQDIETPNNAAPELSAVVVPLLK